MSQDSIQNMSRGELRAMIREALIEVLAELTEQSSDPDAGSRFRPEIAERLRAFQRSMPQGQSAEEVGLDRDV